MSNYGNFKNGCEYAIHKTEIARPQLNYLWNARILSGVNHLGGGNGAYGARACAYIDPDGKGRCSVIRDGNRYFYIKNKKTGKVFNPGWYPCKTEVENFECVHGLGYSHIGAECDGIKAQTRVFINDCDPCEIWTVTLTNTSSEDVGVSAYSFVEFQLEGYQRYSDYNSYVHGEFDEETNTIVCFNMAMERPHEWFNGFISTDVKPIAFDTSKRAFLGVYGGIFEPDGVKADKLSNSLAACEQMVGAFQHDFEIKAGESVTFNVIIGAVDNMDTAKALSNKIFAQGKVEADYSDIEGISGATITTNGYKTAVSKVFEAVKMLEGVA